MYFIHDRSASYFKAGQECNQGEQDRYYPLLLHFLANLYHILRAFISATVFLSMLHLPKAFFWM
jgi:hypothetical protein